MRQVTEVKRWTQHKRVHNLTVSNKHTYYVLAGSVPVLTHNATPTQCKVATTSLEKDYDRRTVGILDIQVDEVPFSSGEKIGGFIDDLASD
ncbi:hypothetical protein AVW11_10485 [Streptomyces amritsarensis]|uniref:Intein C-terminal splicing domain-containing protein n=1 Tax=Streptomyces amritsarensis TaxID=681158 RepID=A0ABX3G8P0_9ACTN|nr:hypothetical protein [Streptomyces amritsarensis]OLZ69204.1 hypothetical protein AVW11_10485 [Streptomyces amritsarensis]